MPELASTRLMAGVRSKDLSCKNKLGHPRLFASLSQQWAKAALLETFDDLEPLHSTQQAAMWTKTVWPLLSRRQQEKEQPNNDALITLLWDQLAKVDYFSPLLWRVDVYGNVLYRFADAGTPLSWSVDHLFPVARGGLSKMPNMRIVQSHAHLNKADSLEFLLTRDMVCTGLSMLDFKVTVKHSLEDLLAKYGKKASALPVQAAPRGATLDRQHNSKSKSTPQPPYLDSVAVHTDEVPLGLKATRVAHAAAVSSRVFSPSMRSPFSGQIPAPALPSRHELDDTLGFVQRQGSFHSEHAIQHLMTDHPHSSRPVHRRSSLPSHHSLSGRDLSDSLQQQGFGSRQSIQADASDCQSQRSYASAPIPQHSSQPQPSGSSSFHKPKSTPSAARPPLGNHRSIASSALFQSAPVPPRNGNSTPHHQGIPQHSTVHRPEAVPAPAVAWEDVHSNSSQHVPAPAVAWEDVHSNSSQHDSVLYRAGHAMPMHEQSFSASSQHQSPVMASAAASTPRDAFQSADSFASEMVDTDVNQTQHWGRTMLAQLQEAPVEHSNEPDLAFQQQLVAEAIGVTPADAFQSSDSFASEMLDTDVNQTQHWGKTMLAQMQRLPEVSEEDAGSEHSRPAVHAALQNLTAEGMLPPDHAAPGPHDWLWLPDELSTLDDSPLSSEEASRPDIHTWLSQQQEARLAKHAQRVGAKYEGQWRQAASPTSPLNTADSVNSTFSDGPTAPDTLPWAVNTMAALSILPQSSSAVQYVQAQDHSHNLQPQLQPEAPVTPEVELPPLLDHRALSQPQVHVEQPVTPQAEYTSPFAHWSSTPILGPMPEPQQAATSEYQPQHTQQAASFEPQPTQQAQHIQTPHFSQQPQHTQPSHQQQQQQLSLPLTRAQEVQDPEQAVLDLGIKQQELSNRLAALDILSSMGDQDAFGAFGSPVQTRQLPTVELPYGDTQTQSAQEKLCVASDQLPGQASSTVLSAPEEALLATMQELLDDAAVEQQELEETIYSSFKFPARTPASMPADNTTFSATPAIPSGRPSSSTPDGFTPRTPELTPPTLLPCKANPVSKFQNLLASQEEGKGNGMSSFHQLLASQQLDEQDRLNKFQELLATQELSRDGKPLVSLAGRVHTMAAQLDVLQQRTRELQAASSAARRVNSPYKGRHSPLKGASGRTSPVSPRPSATAESGLRFEPTGGVGGGSVSPTVARLSQRFATGN